MQLEAFPSVSLHNVAELAPADWTNGGGHLHRVPRDVAANLNVMARDRVQSPTGSEIRFVPEDDDATVEVTLSAAGETTVQPFWGPFQGAEPFTIGPDPSTHTFSVPDRVKNLDPAAAKAVAYDTRICRLRFDAWSRVALHDVAGDARPPRDEELPETRYLAYGTSITEGALSNPHLAYVATAARQLGVDPINLGMAGSAYCEPAIAEHIAGRDDWDFATIAISVNMSNRGFTVAQFRERADQLLDTVAGAHPEKPIVAISLFPYHADVVAGDDPERAAAYRETLETLVSDSPQDNLSFIDGSKLLSVPGLMDDILHPGDAGMVEIGQNLADELAPLVE